MEMTMQLSRRILLTIAMSTMIAVSTTRAQDLSVGSASDWVAEPPSGMFEDASIIPRSDYSFVQGKAKLVAIQILSKAPYHALNPVEIRKYVAKPIRGREPFFVRGVALNLRNGSMSVRANGGSIYVQHNSLGPPNITLKHAPLLIFLPKAPNHVFVSATIDE